MKNKLKKAFFILLKSLGIAIMAYAAVFGWLYWQFFANTFSANPTRELFVGLPFLTMAGMKYMATNMFYLFIGAIGYVIYKVSQQK
jgi:hypothetical protein